MGRVYRAHDPRLNRDVALKLLPPEFSSDPARKARFEREAKAIAALNHPGIVAIYDVGDGWMVTELVDGDILRMGAFNTRQVIDIGAQIAEALAVAHETGISHRDLKPENVMLTRDGRTKILDFGLARIEDVEEASKPPEQRRTVTTPGFPAGTPGYMAPEQVRGQRCDARSDIFCLGLILYELLANKPAFEAPSAIEAMHAIVNQEPDELPPAIPEGLRRIVKRCLEKKPLERFQSARDLAFALRSLTGPFAPPLAAGPPRKSWMWPAAAGAAALAAIALAVTWMRAPQAVSIAGYHFQPFAYTQDQEHSGVWSPDGQSVAFLRQSADGTRLMVQSLDAASPALLAEGINTLQGQVAWSPDGTRVFFMDGATVNSVSRAGGAPERILAGAAAFHLSRDGQALAIWRTSGGADGARRSVWISSPPGAEPVEYMPAPFAVRTPFTPVYLRFSPDGKRLFLSLYTDSGAETWLLPFPAGSGKPRRIFANTAWNRPVAASWMPDSRRIVLSGNPVPVIGEQLWLGDVETETLTRLIAWPAGAQATPSVSPDGRRILFAAVRRDRDIVELPLDGSAPKTILGTNVEEFGPSWSPRGDQFAYVTRHTGSDELWVRSPEGFWDRPIVSAREFPNLETLLSPSFSPDGTRIAYTALLAGGGRRRSLAVSPSAGGAPTVISDGYAPTWSPDGSAIAFLWLKPDGTIPVATLKLGSDAPPVEIVPPRGLGAPEWSPSGEWIAVPSFRGVELISPDGSRQRVLPGFSGAALAWSRDSRTLYGLTFQSLSPALSALDLATGTMRKVTEYALGFQPLLENTYTGSVRLSVAPGGKSAATATATGQSDLWILDGVESPR